MSVTIEPDVIDLLEGSLGTQWVVLLWNRPESSALPDKAFGPFPTREDAEIYELTLDDQQLGDRSWVVPLHAP